MIYQGSQNEHIPAGMQEYVRSENSYTKKESDFTLAFVTRLETCYTDGSLVVCFTWGKRV